MHISPLEGTFKYSPLPKYVMDPVRTAKEEHPASVSIGRFKKANDQDICVTSIPQGLTRRLTARSPKVVAKAIWDLTGKDSAIGIRYPEETVCKLLSRFMQEDKRKAVIKAATNALIEVLIHKDPGEAVILLGEHFSKPGERNLELLIGILSEPGTNAEVKKYAVGLFACYNEEEFEGRRDEIELALLGCVLLEKDRAVKEKVKEFFGRKKRQSPAMAGSSGVQPGQEIPEANTLGQQRSAPTEIFDAIAILANVLEEGTDPEQVNQAAKNLCTIAKKSEEKETILRVMEALAAHGDKFTALLNEAEARLSEVEKKDMQQRDISLSGP